MRNLTVFRLSDVKWLYSWPWYKATRIAVLSFVILTTGWLVSGCSRPPEPQAELAIDTQEPIVREESQGSTQILEESQDEPQYIDESQEIAQNLEREDSQGSVEFMVIPEGFDKESSEVMSFQISMNTHSVDLSMDLAELSTLATDHGVILQATSWSGGTGHHVSGVLSFPASASDGSPIVTGAQKLILTIRDVDAPERVFVWDLHQDY